MSMFLPVLPFAIAFLACLVIATRRMWFGDFQMLPTFGWLVLTCLPFCLEFPLFNPETRMVHGLAISFMLAIFMTCDLNFGKMRALIPTQLRDRDKDHRNLMLFGYAVGIFFVVVSGTHLYFVDNIPYLEALRTHDQLQIIADRIKFSRSYDGIPGMKYLYSFSVYIFAIPALLILLKCRQWPSVVILVVWTVLYCIASTAKGPLITMVVIALIGLCDIIPQHKRVLLMRSLIVCGFAGFFALAGLDAFGSKQTLFSNLPAKYAAATSDKNPDLMLGDYFRRLPRDQYEKEVFPMLRYVDYYLYRIVQTPIEVSARWYEYFHLYPVQETRLSRTILDSRLQQEIHPANAVGRWAYYERFPTHYTPEAFAYASIDADSYGRFGLWGLVCAGFLYAFMRLWLALCDDTSGLTQGIFGATGAAILSLMPTSTSIQALVMAQGMGMLMVILGLLKAWEIWRSYKRVFIKSSN